MTDLTGKTKEDVIDSLLKKAKQPDDGVRDIPGESNVKIANSLNPSLDSRLTRNIERSVRAKHTTLCDFDHLEQRVVPAIQKALLEDFKAEIGLMPQKHVLATSEPFVLTMSFWSRKRMLKKIEHKVMPEFDRAWEDTVNDLLSRLPKMLWGLKKTYNSGRSEMFMVALEWLESVDSAPLKDVVELITREKPV